MKKIMFSLITFLSIAMCSVIAFIGLSSTPKTAIGGGTSKNIGEEVIIDNPTPTPIIEPKTITYNWEDVQLVAGSKTINYTYEADNNAKDSSGIIAYKYCFGSGMEDPMAVNLKTIPTENVTISYAYSLNTPLESEPTTLTTNTKFECQVLPAKNDQIYIYVVISPSEGFNSVNFTQEIVWYMGMKGQVNIVNGTETITQTIVKGQELTENILNTPTIEEGYTLDGWYYDSACTIEATFPFRTQGMSLYPKVITIRDSVVYALNGTTDSEGYTLYGAYPQDYVGSTLNTTLKNALSAGTLKASGWTYTTDINGTSTILTEYEYEGSYYAYLSSSKSYNSSYTFNTDTTTTIGTGNAYFFKVEPLRWTNHNGTYLCEYNIGSRAFDPYYYYDEDAGEEYYITKWEESAIRTYLNEVFYIESGISLVKKEKTTIQNNTTSGETTDGAGTPTEDYMWLPSYQEMTTWYSDNASRRKGCSDLAKATYTYWYSSYSSCYYWTRSASSSTYVYYVYYDGPIDDFDFDPSCTDYGVCPAFAL